jgi:hypothetical protein
MNKEDFLGVYGKDYGYHGKVDKIRAEAFARLDGK